MHHVNRDGVVGRGDFGDGELARWQVREDQYPVVIGSAGVAVAAGTVEIEADSADNIIMAGRMEVAGRARWAFGLMDLEGPGADTLIDRDVVPEALHLVVVG